MSWSFDFLSVNAFRNRLWGLVRMIEIIYLFMKFHGVKWVSKENISIKFCAFCFVQRFKRRSAKIVQWCPGNKLCIDLQKNTMSQSPALNVSNESFVCDKEQRSMWKTSLSDVSLGYSIPKNVSHQKHILLQFNLRNVQFTCFLDSFSFLANK